eukprot:3482037-Amphidinium_carterae.2
MKLSLKALHVTIQTSVNIAEKDCNCIPLCCYYPPTLGQAVHSTEEDQSPSQTEEREFKRQ